jgi:YidC/Oxa1 family membrane protein insertase
VNPGPILPGTLALGDGRSDAAVEYRADRPSVEVHGADRATVVFSGQGPEGQRIEKRYTFTGDGYVFDLAADVPATGAGERALVLTPLATAGTDSSGHAATAIALVQRRLVQEPVTEILEGPLAFDAVAWAGFEAQYFLTVALPADAPGRAAMGPADGTAVARVSGSGGGTAFTVYAGPKQQDVLAAVGHELDRAVDFGWFWFIALPLLEALRLIYNVTGNYGVAIIVLTTVIKVLTIPLTQVTFRNMREMQKIQPQMLKLRERFKDDQVAMQKEMMELYRRHRVNPFSGCLPMLLQLPIFVGLYNALSHAIELRHAPFGFWIDDLSSPDRLMIAGFGVPVLTLLMGASMLVQQWLSPQQGDPTQQRMMMIMPIIFTFMFINFRSGLVLYWLVNNVLTIGHQYYMLRNGR